MLFLAYAQGRRKGESAGPEIIFEYLPNHLGYCCSSFPSRLRWNPGRIISINERFTRSLFSISVCCNVTANSVPLRLFSALSFISLFLVTKPDIAVSLTVFIVDHFRWLTWGHSWVSSVKKGLCITMSWLSQWKTKSWAFIILSLFSFRSGSVEGLS